MIAWEEWPGPPLKGRGVNGTNQGPLRFPNVVVSRYLEEFAKAVVLMVGLKGLMTAGHISFRENVPQCTIV